MAVERLIEEIQKLSLKEKRELLQKLGILADTIKKEQFRGGSDDPLVELMGIGEGPEDGSIRYKDYLYGKNNSV